MSVRFGPFELDEARRQLLRGGSEIHLTPKAFDLLALLVAEAPRVVRKTELHERLWPGTFVADATLVGLVKEVRRALDDRDAAAPFIRTSHGIGYAFAGRIEGGLPLETGAGQWVVIGTRRIALNHGENVIGRDPSSAIQLEAAGVSRRHARILVEANQACVEDLASKNGTKVNDKQVSGQAILHDGDRVQIGPALIVFRTSASGVSTETLLTSPVR